MYILVIFLCISNQKCTSDSCCCVCTIFIFSVYTVANSAFFNTTFLDKELSDIYTKGQFIHYLLTIEAFIWVVCIQQHTTELMPIKTWILLNDVLYYIEKFLVFFIHPLKFFWFCTVTQIKTGIHSLFAFF